MKRKKNQRGFFSNGKKGKNEMKGAAINPHQRRSGILYTMTALLVILLCFVAVTLFLLTKQNRHEQEWGRLATDVQVLSQQMTKSAIEAASGKRSAFLDLSSARSQIADAMMALKAGDTVRSVPSLPVTVANEAQALDDTWQRMSGNVSTILEREALVLRLTSSNEGRRSTRGSQVETDAAVRGAADQIQMDSRTVFEQARMVSVALQTQSEKRIWPSLWAALLPMVIILAIMGYMVRDFLAEERKRALSAGMQNQKHQRAILQLLDEMSSLADGDLTVRATVSDDMTGSIADSVNYAVEQLRELVTGINITAQTVSESAQSTMEITSQLATSSTRQAEQVRSVTKTIDQMSKSFDAMASRSRQSSEVAQRSVEIANNGSEMVQQTMEGMDTIRDQIQDTSKRIKRLGESSQEIGDIVELINGIAEQTNILALNAAIQSASAGGAGRGFAVVADEVQLLAERATNATRRIEILVKTIQADTSEAVISIESTTTEVVLGAKRAEDAGEALGRIESVSKDLSALIEQISQDAQSQSKTASAVAEQMNSIRDISIQTSEGTNQTAEAMDTLTQLVGKLRDSVADFKLPTKPPPRAAERTTERKDTTGLHL